MTESPKASSRGPVSFLVWIGGASAGTSVVLAALGYLVHHAYLESLGVPRTLFHAHPTEYVVSGAKMLLAILRVLDPIPTLGNDQDANMRFVIDHSRVDFQAISIRDRSLFLAGTGTMRLGEEKSLDVVLLAGDPPDRSTPLTVLEEFVQGALQELVEVRIKGTLDKPAIQSRPLRSLDRAIRTLTDTPDVTKR